MEIGDIPRNWWIYIDPVIWPEDEDRWKNMIKNLISKGHKFFILNSFYHIGLIDTKKVDVWLGPFANVANLQAIYMARWMGFKGVVVSIELSKQEYIELATNSPLPLGVFIKGIWPYTTSRTKHPELHLDTLYLSPKKEGLWVKEIGANYYVFPDRLIDLTHKRRELKKAGYKLFLEFLNPIPKCIQLNSFD
jgi:putative protease